MDLQRLATQVILHFDRNTSDPNHCTPLPHLVLLRHEQPTEMHAMIYEPVVCLILQGYKETVLGETTLQLGPGESMVVSHDLPVVSRITGAQRNTPYLAMVLMLDVPLLRSLYEQVGEAVVERPTTRAMAVHKTDPRLLDCFARYLALVHDPVEQRVMEPLIRKEIHFRLLMAPHGGMLRKLLRYDSHASKIARAIARIRRDFRTPIAIPALARDFGMSSSSFHKHFKDITATTPLQYQKEMRLLEARRLLFEGDQSVSSVAYEVGYESPTQFSREYSRKFGRPPGSDLRAHVRATTASL